MKACLTLLLGLLLLCTQATQASAQRADSPGTSRSDRSAHSVPQIQFEKYTLPNGLNVILHADRKLPVVHVNQWYHVGSKNERVGRSGFAHLFEHVMFQGSKNASLEYFDYVEEAGANLFEGGVNGTTSWDRTNYFATVPSGSLEMLLWLESDRLATLLDALTQEKLDNQRDVVKNERRQRLENTPYGRSWSILFQSLFPYRHPYANDVIGSHEDLSAATLDDVREFFQTFYTPNNLSLVIAGDFEPSEAKRLVEKYFGSIPPGPALDRPKRNVVILDGEKVIEVRDRVPQERVYMAWHSPAFFEPGDAELDLAATLLTDGLSAWLRKALVYDRQLASDVTAWQASLEIASVFVIVATARPGTSLSEIEQVITQEIARLSKDGPTRAELDRAKTKWEYNFVTDLERIGGFGGKADRLNQYNTLLGDPGRFDEDLARYRSATVQTVREAVARHLATRNRVVVRFRPEESERPTVAEVDRSVQPALGADKSFPAPVVSSVRLDNGMEVLVVTRTELPKVAVRLATRAGSVADPMGEESVAYLTAQTMKRGTRTKSALQIEDALGDLGTSLNAAINREHAALDLEVLKRNLSPALALLADVARNPTFPAAEAEREKNLLLDALAQEAQNPQGIAGRIGPMLLFGREHPYGRSRRGLPASVQGLSAEDFSRFHEQNWKAGSSALILVGDVTLEEATALARQHFGAWAGGAAPAASIPPPHPIGPNKVYVVDRPGAAQTFIAQLLPGTPRTAEDYHALLLADAVWGGGFGTRLNLNLREDKGYSYGVFSFPEFHSAAGAWIADGGVQADKTKESIAEFLKELNGIAGEHPITAEELAKARANRTRGYAQQFETLGRVADQIEALWVHGLPMTELQRHTDMLRQVPLEAVNASARRYALPSNTTLLLIGDRSIIENAVRDLNLGTVVVLDPEGKAISGTRSH